MRTIGQTRPIAPGADKQEYGYTSRKAGKVYFAGVFKPGGHPTEWMDLLQPMTKTEAQLIGILTHQSNDTPWKSAPA